MTDTAERFDAVMRQALVLARRGPEHDRNPRVGCVILDADGDVTARGWHRGVGTAHAEVDALAKLAPGDAAGATAVVTLEPCSHTGTTGPCTTALIDAGISRVVYGATDPGMRSRGGAKLLAAAGVEVIGGVLPIETTELIEDWLLTARLNRPFVTVKWASSLDGRTAAQDGTSRWITGPAARANVHEQRKKADAILVGTGTVLSDDPQLTARSAAGSLMLRQPVPVVVGRRAIPADAMVFAHPHQPILEATHDLAGVLCRLHERGVRRVFVEGGPTLASAFVAADLVDEYLIYLAPTLIGGDRPDRLALGDIGVSTLVERRDMRIRSLHQLGNDILVVGRTAKGA